MSATAEPNSHQLGSRMSLKSGPATTWLVHSNVSQLTYVSILFPRSGSLLPLETPAEGPYILPVPFAGLTSTRTEVTGTALIGSPRPLNLLSFLAPSASGSHIHERAGSRFRESISAVGLTAKICDRIALPGVRHWFGAHRATESLHHSPAPNSVEQLTDNQRGPDGTMKDTLLESVPLGVTTLTSPVMAPAGTVVVISELDTTVKLAAVPLKVTLVAPVRLVPSMLTAAPAAPEPGCVSTNGLRPRDRLKPVPHPTLP